MREHMENSWIEAEVDGEVFYVNYFYQKKTQWEKPRNGFIKRLPRTEQSQGDSKRKLGREGYIEHLREGELIVQKRELIEQERERIGQERERIVQERERIEHLREEERIQHLRERELTDRTEHLREIELIQHLREKELTERIEHLRERELIKGMTTRKNRYGEDGSGPGEDRDREPEMTGCTKLYQAVYRGFKEIIGRVSEPSNDDHKSVEPLSSFKPWIESLWTRLKSGAKRSVSKKMLWIHWKITKLKLRTPISTELLQNTSPVFMRA
jgi:hypothetical protein